MNKIIKQGFKGIKGFIFILFSFFFFTLLLCSCSTKRITMTEYVHDTLVTKSLLHDTCYREIIHHDTLFMMKTIKTETTITQDTAGVVINRESNTTTDTDTYHASALTDKDYKAKLVQDSLSSSKSKETQKVSEKVKTDNWFTRLWHIALQIIGMVVVLMIGFIIGRLWSQIKQVLPL